MTDLVVFGAGQIADVISTYLEHHVEDRVVAYTVDRDFRKADQFRGLPLLDWETLERDYPPTQVHLFGPVSYRDGNRFRRDRFLEGKRRGYRFYTFIHPDAYVYTREIGENVVILEGNTVQPFAAIGDNCVLWSHNHIGHHTRVGAHCFLTTHVGLGGSTQVGEGVFFAGKSAVVDNACVGEWCFFGPGAIATADVSAETIVRAPKARTIARAASKYAKRLLG